jgi:EAL domain-containing protein (putative c-di-GMP-specific phosphodiesterase class I)
VKLRWTDPAQRDLGGKGVRALTENDLSAVFQPILSLSDGSTIAHEALARCVHPPFTSPLSLFAQAAREKACGRLGRIVRNVIFEQCERKPVFINLHPQELHQRWLVQPTDPIFLHDAPVYLEITESAALRYFDVCLSVLAEVCGRCNGRLVVDDLGAGYSDMDRVLALRPQVVKLDMSLVRDIDQDVLRQRYVLDIVERCHDLGAQVVAEGIEGLDELHAVRDLGVEFGQGYLFGKPLVQPTEGLWPVGHNTDSEEPRSR